MRWVWAACVLGAASLGCAAEAQDFYRGTQITLLSPSEAGSGYDAYARLLARHLPRHLAGVAAILVQNMPGAGGLREANYLYNVAAKDGLTIGQISNEAPFEPFYGNRQAQFDPRRFAWLGSPSRETTLFLISGRLPAHTIAEARRLELHIAGSSSTGSFYSRLLNAIFGLAIKPVEGYGGFAEALLAMERGENDGYSFGFWSTLTAIHADWIAEGKIRFLLRYSGAVRPGLEDVPLAEDIAASEADRLALRVAAAPFSLGRPLAAPPGTPDARRAALETAIAASFADPAYRRDCAAQHLDCSEYLSAGQVGQIVRDAYAAPDAVRTRLIALHGN